MVVFKDICNYFKSVLIFLKNWIWWISMMMYPAQKQKCFGSSIVFKNTKKRWNPNIWIVLAKKVFSTEFSTDWALIEYLIKVTEEWNWYNSFYLQTYMYYMRPWAFHNFITLLKKLQVKKRRNKTQTKIHFLKIINVEY